MANPLSGLFSDGGFVDRLGDQSNYLSTLGAGLLAHRQNANNPIMGDPRALALASAADQERQKAKQEEIAKQQSKNATVQFLMAQRGLDEGTAMQIVQGDPAILNSVLKGEDSPEGTAAIQNYQFLRSLPPEERAAFEAAMGGGPSTVVNVGGEGDADAKMREEFAKAEGKRWSTLQEGGFKAAESAQDFELLDELIKVAPQGPVQGRAAQLFPGVSTAGAAFQSVVKRIAPTLRTPGSGSTSDIEYAGLEASLPNLANDPTANALISDAMKAKAEINVQRAEVVTAYQNEEISGAEARRKLAELNRKSILSPQLKARISGLGTGTGAVAAPSALGTTRKGVPYSILGGPAL